jgi:hypothetical protein
MVTIHHQKELTMKQLRMPRLLARAVLAIALGGALALGAGALTATSATAAVPTGGPPAPISQADRVDQCGSQGSEWVPDRGPTFDFRDACRRHDICYGTQPYGSNNAGRKACDAEFLRNASKSCAAHNRFAPSVAACTRIAAVYYRGLRLFGGKAFNRAKNPTVTVGPPEQIHEGGNSGGRSSGPVGGGSGPIGGGPAPNPTVTVGEPEKVETSSK